LRAWFEAQHAKLFARGPTAEAIGYALNHWDGWCDPRLHIFYQPPVPLGGPVIYIEEASLTTVAASISRDGQRTQISRDLGQVFEAFTLWRIRADRNCRSDGLKA
jgi:hypothetical protein